jgi:hypothetical protein
MYIKQAEREILQSVLSQWLAAADAGDIDTSLIKFKRVQELRERCEAADAGEKEN